MFLDESAFDRGDDSEFSKPLSSSNKPFTMNQGRYNNSGKFDDYNTHT